MDAGPLLRGILVLWPDNQSRKDGGAPPTCTILSPPPSPLTTLANVEHFKYLGSSDGSLDREIDTRISKASQVLGSLRNIHLSTKPWFFLPSSMVVRHGNYRRHIKKLVLFHMRALRSILGMRWQDHIINLKVLDQAKSTSIEATIIKAQLRWVGHVIRMGECRMPRRLMYGELQTGKRNQGRPKLWCHINLRDLEGYAMDRTKWRGSVHRAAANFEEARCQKLTAERDTAEQPRQ